MRQVVLAALLAVGSMAVMEADASRLDSASVITPEMRLEIKILKAQVLQGAIGVKRTLVADGKVVSVADLTPQTVPTTFCTLWPAAGKKAEIKDGETLRVSSVVAKIQAGAATAQMDLGGRMSLVCSNRDGARLRTHDLEAVFGGLASVSTF